MTTVNEFMHLSYEVLLTILAHNFATQVQDVDATYTALQTKYLNKEMLIPLIEAELKEENSLLVTYKNYLPINEELDEAAITDEVIEMIIENFDFKNGFTEDEINKTQLKQLVYNLEGLRDKVIECIDDELLENDLSLDPNVYYDTLLCYLLFYKTVPFNAIEYYLN